MISRRIMVLSAATVVCFAYFIFFKDRDDLLIYLAVSLVLLVIAYVFQFQIDQIMTRGVPLKLDQAMRDMLNNTSSHYRLMPPSTQLLIEDRMMRWVIQKEFINKNEQEAPEDVKYILAYYAVLLTIHQKEFLYTGLDRIVFYHHPFLSPHHMDEVHIAEMENEDGVLIISVPHLLKGHLEKGHYNIALHLMAEAYARLYINKSIEWDEDIWSRLEAISTISKSALDLYIGIPLTDPWPVAVHHQMTYRDIHIEEVIQQLPQSDSIRDIVMEASKKTNVL